MKAKLSKLASFKLEKLLQYLKEEWSESAKIKFLKKLNDKIEAIQSNPALFSQSQSKPALRKCVVTKQTSILYTVQKDHIFVVTVFDNRQDQKKIKEEIKKHFPDFI